MHMSEVISSRSFQITFNLFDSRFQGMHSKFEIPFSKFPKLSRQTKGAKRRAKDDTLTKLFPNALQGYRVNDVVMIYRRQNDKSYATVHKLMM